MTGIYLLKEGEGCSCVISSVYWLKGRGLISHMYLGREGGGYILLAHTDDSRVLIEGGGGN